MSTTDLYIVNRSSTTHLAEFKNGYGSGPVAWDWLGARYLGVTGRMADDEYTRLWALARDPTVKTEHRCVLMMTFDYAYVPFEHLSIMGQACKEFYQEIFNPKLENHWDGIGDALIDLSTKRKSHYARGVAMSCTSVNNMWASYNHPDLSRAWSIFK